MSGPIYFEARSLLRARLLATPGFQTSFPGGAEWQGEDYQSTIGKAYVRETLKQGQSVRTALGPSYFIRHNALYLLDIFSPAENGADGTDLLGDLLQNQFYPGLALPGSSTVVKIKRASPGDGTPDSQWRMNAMTIVFYFDTLNP